MTHQTFFQAYKSKQFPAKDVLAKTDEVKKVGKPDMNTKTAGLSMDELLELARQNSKQTKRPHQQEANIPEKKAKIVGKPTTDGPSPAPARDNQAAFIDLTAQTSNEFMEVDPIELTDDNVTEKKTEQAKDAVAIKTVPKLNKENQSSSSESLLKVASPAAGTSREPSPLSDTEVALKNTVANTTAQKRIDSDSSERSQLRKPNENEREPAKGLISVRPMSQIKITNGRLSDATGSIKLLNQSHKPNQPVSSSSLSSTSSSVAAENPDTSINSINLDDTANLSPYELQQTLLKVFTERSQRIKLPFNNSLERSPRRTDAGRSRSLHSLENKAIRKKIIQARKKESLALAASSRKMQDVSQMNIDDEWDSLTEALAQPVGKAATEQLQIDDDDLYFDMDKQLKSVKESSEANKQRGQSTLKQNQNNKISGVGHGKFEIKSSQSLEIPPPAPPAADTSKPNKLSLPFLSDLERVISWNRQNRTGVMPNAIVTFERNEFGMVELNDENRFVKRCESPKLRGRAKRKPEVIRLPCGHLNFDECFNELIMRFMKEFWVNQATPSDYHSSEFKDLIRTCIKKHNQQCTMVTREDLMAAMNQSKHFKKAGVGVAKGDTFNWRQYLDKWNLSNPLKLSLAPIKLFSNPFPASENPFKIGHKLEAIDPLHCSMFCVCTVADIRGNRLKLHFDGYHHAYDFWVNADSMDIFPNEWCSKTGRELQPPYAYNTSSNQKKFNWSDYLTASSSLAAPKSCFTHLNSSVGCYVYFGSNQFILVNSVPLYVRVCIMFM